MGFIKISSSIIFSIIFFSHALHAGWVDAFRRWTPKAIGDAYVMNSHNIYQLPESQDLIELRLNYGDMPFYQIAATLSDEEIIRNNENLIRLSKQDIPVDTSMDGLPQLENSLTEATPELISAIYESMQATPVVESSDLYGSDGIGFCFGRALAAHIHALRAGIHPDSIRKVWVIGDMGFWGHHVSTIIKVKGDWMAIDNFTGLMNVEKWIETIKKSREGERPLMFFITRAGRFGHENNRLYDSIDLFNQSEFDLDQFNSEEGISKLKSKDFYKGFFIDFFKYIDDLDKKTI